jgi:hypothetical protein
MVWSASAVCCDVVAFERWTAGQWLLGVRWRGMRAQVKGWWRGGECLEARAKAFDSELLVTICQCHMMLLSFFGKVSQRVRVSSALLFLCSPRP